MTLTGFLITVLLIGYVLVALFMALIILMQRSKQEGLGAAFGGGFTDSVWGAQTSQVLVKGTVVFAATFFLLAISLDRLYANQAESAREESPVQKALLAPVDHGSIISPSLLGTNSAPVAPKP